MREMRAFLNGETGKKLIQIIEYNIISTSFLRECNDEVRLGKVEIYELIQNLADDELLSTSKDQS
jgi:hypothetical protein